MLHAPLHAELAGTRHAMEERFLYLRDRPDDRIHRCCLVHGCHCFLSSALLVMPTHVALDLDGLWVQQLIIRRGAQVLVNAVFEPLDLLDDRCRDTEMKETLICFTPESLILDIRLPCSSCLPV